MNQVCTELMLSVEFENENTHPRPPWRGDLDHAMNLNRLTHRLSSKNRALVFTAHQRGTTYYISMIHQFES